MAYSYKIYKMASSKSIMDVLDALEYYKENKNNEMVYKGNIVFLINDYSSTKQTEKAFVSKASAKLLSFSIINHHFPVKYSNVPFKEYGGTINGDDVRSRIFTVEYNSNRTNQYCFRIDEGPGRVGSSGNIEMKKVEKTLAIFASEEEAIKMSHEIYSFIQHSELIALSKGKPLVTLLPKRNEANDATTNIEAHHVSDDCLEVEDMQNKENVGYIIKIGTLAGQNVAQLDSEMLEVIVAKVVPESEEKAELLEAVKSELRIRNK